MRDTTIGIIDYGSGNHRSVITAVQEIGHNPVLKGINADFKDCDILLLPGVGSYAKIVRNLCEYSLYEQIKTWGAQGKPIIGICLGMQILSSYGTEGGLTNGLDLISGINKAMNQYSAHIGWNSIVIENQDLDFCNKFNDCDFYFNHSYYFTGLDSRFVIANTIADNSFQDIKIPSIIKKENIIGFQFHPEKSQANGIALLSATINQLKNA